MSLTAVVVEHISQTGAVWWLPLAVPVALAAVALGAAALLGPRHLGPLRRVTHVLRTITGLPRWAATAITVAMWSLAVALLGFVWDVAWHADLGRDQQLFTPPHVMILTGLTGIGVAACSAIALATADAAPVGLRAGRLRVPWSALAMGILATDALCGFPLDDYWHATYGIDVTMWSPTHLLMIGGAALTPIAMWLMLGESGAPRVRRTREISAFLATAVLLGLSGFQLEFDLGIPQWQALYHPVLVASAMGIGLIAAREALGRWGALRTAIAFDAMRLLIALVVGGPFGLTTPRFPLYVGGALVIEAVYALWQGRSVLLRALTAGAAVATAGMAAEWGWIAVTGAQPWQPRLLESWWVVLAAALAGAVIGTLLGRAVSQQSQPLHLRGALVAAVVLVGALAVPFPRHGAAATATVRATPAGPQVPVLTRDGLLSLEQPVRVTVSVSPASAVDGADLFRVIAWQGGGIVTLPLHATGDGTYTAGATIPTGGDWKSLVMLENGATVAAVPVEMPVDPQYAQPAIPAPVGAPRTEPLVAASTYLMRESHGGAATVAVLAYTFFGLAVTLWFLALIGAGDAMRRHLRATLTLHGVAFDGAPR